MVYRMLYSICHVKINITSRIEYNIFVLFYITLYLYGMWYDIEIVFYIIYTWCHMIWKLYSISYHYMWCNHKYHITCTSHIVIWYRIIHLIYTIFVIILHVNHKYHSTCRIQHTRLLYMSHVFYRCNHKYHITCRIQHFYIVLYHVVFHLYCSISRDLYCSISRCILIHIT